MYLIIGLGNPEGEYSRTRHNMGFDVINKLSEKYDIKVNKSKFEALYGVGKIEEEKVALIKPQTYMNLSGKSVKQFVSFYKVDPQEILIIYDDIDVKKGEIKIRKQGGPGNHNGMKSIINEISTKDFPRIRIGTGEDNISNLVDFVINKVDDDTYKELETGINKAADAVTEIMKNGLDSAMNKLN